VSGQPIQRCDHHAFEAAGLDLDHQPIVRRLIVLLAGLAWEKAGGED
jgi:hypothetical protein